MSLFAYEQMRREREEHAKPLADALRTRLPYETEERMAQTARVLLDNHVVVMQADHERLRAEHAALIARVKAIGAFLVDPCGS